LPQRVLGCPASIPRLQLCRRAARSTKTLERDRNLRYQHTADIRIHLQRLKRDTDSSDGERLQNVCCCIMGAQANKGKTVQTAASREKRIRWLMGEDGARRLGHQVPRWEAEQLVAPVGALLGMLDREEQRRKQDLERQQGLSKELHGHGYVGRAFEELCKAGCDARWLESVLLDLIEFPLGQSHATYTAKETPGASYRESGVRSTRNWRVYPTDRLIDFTEYGRGLANASTRPPDLLARHRLLSAGEQGIWIYKMEGLPQDERRLSNTLFD